MATIQIPLANLYFADSAGLFRRVFCLNCLDDIHDQVAGKLLTRKEAEDLVIEHYEKSTDKHWLSDYVERLRNSIEITALDPKVLVLFFRRR